MRFIRPTIVRKYAHAKERKVSKSFLNQLDHHVAKMIELACTIHNGGKKMLDGELFEVINKIQGGRI